MLEAMRRLLFLLAACGGQRSEPPPKLAGPGDAVAKDAGDPLAADPRKWFAGDVHMHVAPPDDPADVTLDVRAIADGAVAAGLDFVVLTPHLWPARWGSEFREQWRTLADQATAIAKPTMIPGVEWSDNDGHFTVTGIDIAKLRGKNFLDAADRAG